jgi:hypothetical protein
MSHRNKSHACGDLHRLQVVLSGTMASSRTAGEASARLQAPKQAHQSCQSRTH